MSETLELRGEQGGFRYHEADFSNAVDSMIQSLVDVVDRFTEIVEILKPIRSSREEPNNFPFSNGIVKGSKAHFAHGLEEIYLSRGLSVVQNCFLLDMVVATEEKYSPHGSWINITTDEMNMDAHVDENPITAVLYFQDFDEEDGGRAVFANDKDVRTRVEILNSSTTETRISPKRGKFIVYKGDFAHFVEPLTEKGLQKARLGGFIGRAASPMNYWSNNSPENSRDPNLNMQVGLA